MSGCRSLVIVISVVFGVCATFPAVADTPPLEAGKKAAMAWIQLVDEGNYGEAWNAAAGSFQEDVSREEWTEMMRTGRQGLGAVTERKLVSERFTREIPGAPTRDYVVVEYDTSFEGKGSVVEKITVVKEGEERWRVSAYIFGY